MVVGDIALLELGEVIPCDGVFLSGHNLKCDESGVTGELDAIKKVFYDECITRRIRPDKWRVPWHKWVAEVWVMMGWFNIILYFMCIRLTSLKHSLHSNYNSIKCCGI